MSQYTGLSWLALAGSGLAELVVSMLVFFFRITSIVVTVTTEHKMIAITDAITVTIVITVAVMKNIIITMVVMQSK